MRIAIGFFLGRVPVQPGANLGHRTAQACQMLRSARPRHPAGSFRMWVGGLGGWVGGLGGWVVGGCGGGGGLSGWVGSVGGWVGGLGGVCCNPYKKVGGFAPDLVGMFPGRPESPRPPKTTIPDRPTNHVPESTLAAFVVCCHLALEVISGAVG